jgi:hypothetical protein
MLGTDKPVKVSQKSGTLTLTAPALSPAALPGRFAYVFKLENAL